MVACGSRANEFATEGEACTVSAQGQLRAGVSDLGVNQARIRRLWAHQPIRRKILIGRCVHHEDE
eukprot:1060630-Prorocentrum_minimum.AAC.2